MIRTKTVEVTMVFDDERHKDIGLMVFQSTGPGIVVDAEDETETWVYLSEDLALRARIQKAFHEEFYSNPPASISCIVDKPLERRFSFMKGDKEAFSLSASDLKLMGEEVWRHFQGERVFADTVRDVKDWAHPDGAVLW